MARANLFSIPPGAPFLRTFVEALLAGKITGAVSGDDPLTLSSATIYVPTRRAARALAGEFAQSPLARSILLPRIVPLGQADEIETSLAFEVDSLDDGWEDVIPAAIDEFERRLTLASLILAWGRAVRRALLPLDKSDAMASQEALLVAATAGQAWLLAGDLAGLIDELIIEEIPWSALDGAVPEEFDRYWEITLNFLKIAGEHWPRILAERDCVDAAARRALLIGREAERIETGRPLGPTIALGSTGTNRATARLLAAIARSPAGAVILPGLDRDLDAESWTMVGVQRPEAGAAGHPQAALRRLLEGLPASRETVEELGDVSSALARRTHFLREALLPAEATERWPLFDRSGLAAGLADVALIEAPDEREEALSLAIRLREALETPRLTAALVTPDRAIAARVRAELARWKIEIEDSAGESLATRQAGAFARLVLKAAAGPDLAVDFLALIAHPLTLLGFDRERVRTLAALAEIALVRGETPFSPDLAALLANARALANDAHAHPAVRDAEDETWGDLERLLRRLGNHLGGLRKLASSAPLAAWIAAHRAAIAAIGDGGNETADDRALGELLDRLEAAAQNVPLVFDMQDYADFFDSAAGEAAVRSGPPGHPRLKILGLLEARLMSVDVVLLAGLDETIWPPAAATDPFLNRPMRAALGLSPPERRIGQTAHDFAQAMGAPVVVLSRAAKRGGVPTTPSRFLQRMQALAGPSCWDECRGRGDAWLRLARMIDQAGPTKPIGAPHPRPSLDLRPRRLSVTRIETLRRDPYAVYAESILRLTPLAQVEAAEAGRTAGVELHDVLADFVRRHPSGALPSEASAALRQSALMRFGPLLDDLEWRAFHWPRFERAIDAFVSWENGRREQLAEVFVEERGELAISLADGSRFTLVAIADRLERRSDGQWIIIDYKSGRVPSVREVACGFAPQLTLEAAMIERGAFRCAPAPSVVEKAVYVRLAGSEPISEREVRDAKRQFQELVYEHFEGAIGLLSQFRNETTPYLSRPFPQFASRFGAYDHLARVKEWSSPALEGEEG